MTIRMNPLADLPRVKLDGWKARIAEAETVEEVEAVEDELARAAKDALGGIQERRVRRDLRAVEAELLWDALGEVEAALRNGLRLCRKRREALGMSAQGAFLGQQLAIDRAALINVASANSTCNSGPTPWARLDQHEGN